MDPQVHTKDDRCKHAFVDDHSLRPEVDEALFIDPSFDTGNANVVHIDGSQDMRGLGAVGVKSARLQAEADAGNSKCPKPILFCNRCGALDPREPAATSQTFGKVRHIEIGKDRR